MIAISIRPPLGRALIAAVMATASAAGAAIAVGPRAHRPVTVTIEPATVPTYLPLSGSGWRDRGQAACLAFLAEWARHPGWTLGLRRGDSTCVGDSAGDSLVIAGDGTATWRDDRGHGGAVALPEPELTELLAAAGDACVRPVVDDAAGPLDSGWIDVAWTGAGATDIRVRGSAARDRLRSVLDRVGASYRDHRLAERGRFVVEAVVPAGAGLIYIPRDVRLTVDDTGRVVARVRGRRAIAVRFDPAELVAILDWIERADARPYEAPMAVMHVLGALRE